MITRLARLEALLLLLDAAATRGERALVTDTHLQLEVERALQVSIQICIDVGAHLVSELSLKPPDDYAGVFLALAQGRVIDAPLAERLGDAARLRNLLVHDYAGIDHHRLWLSLASLDDLRAFATVAQRLADGDPAQP